VSIFILRILSVVVQAQSDLPSYRARSLERQYHRTADSQETSQPDRFEIVSKVGAVMDDDRAFMPNLLKTLRLEGSITGQLAAKVRNVSRLGRQIFSY